MCGMLALPAAATAQNGAPLTGVWDVSVVSPEGETSATLAVSDDDGRLAGVLGRPGGNIAVEGARTADTVTLRFSVQYEGAPLPIVMTAPPGGDALAGMVDFARGQASGTWKASRATATGINGVWAFSADGGEGAIPGVLTLLERNGEVSGRLVVRSRGVDGVVKGTRAESALKLSVDATADGSPVTIDMPGNVDGEALSGTFSVADISGRWSATRQ